MEFCGWFAWYEAVLIRVVGKQDPKRMYLLMGEDEIAHSEVFNAFKRQYFKLLAADKASKYLQAYRNGLQFGYDLTNFYNTYQNRITEFASKGVDDDWDGVYQAQLK